MIEKKVDAFDNGRAAELLPDILQGNLWHPPLGLLYVIDNISGMRS